jgi:hypothetical protein
MLNNWSTTPLLLAGLWSPPTPLVQEAVVQGVDAALCFTDEDETLQPIKQASKLTTSLASTNVPKLDEDMAFRLIIESDRNIPSGMLAPLGSPSVAIPPALVPPEEEVRLSQSHSSSRVDDLPEEVDSQIVLVTRLRMKNSRSTSPAVLEETKVNVAVAPSLPSTPPQSLSEELAAAEALTDAAGDEQEETEEEASTFEDLLENYSNFNIGNNALTKSPNYSPTESTTRDSSPEEKFEIVSGKFIQITQYESWNLFVILFDFDSRRKKSAIAVCIHAADVESGMQSCQAKLSLRRMFQPDWPNLRPCSSL